MKTKKPLKNRTNGQKKTKEQKGEINIKKIIKKTEKNKIQEET